MSPVFAVKQALKEAGHPTGFLCDCQPEVFRGGEDPGGYSSHGSLACVVHEGTDVPDEYNHPDPLQWWIDLGDRVSTLLGYDVFFESHNSCVSSLYRS